MDNNETDILYNIQQQGIINKADSIFTLKNIDKNISYLESNSDVKVIGTFKPKTAGKYKLEASFKYIEGETVKLATDIMVMKDSLKALLKAFIYVGLNDEVVANSLHEVRLLVTNQANFTATLKNIEAGNLLAETIIIEVNKKIYKLDEFNALSALEKKLNQGKQIKIEGKYRAKDLAGKDGLGVKVNYFIDKNLEIVGLSFDEIENGSTTIISKKDANVVVMATVNPRTKKMKMNGEETLDVTFRNTSAKYPATDVEIIISIDESEESEAKKLKINRLEAGEIHKETFSFKVVKNSLIKVLPLVAKVSYNEGKSVSQATQIVVGYLPKQGSTLLAISDSGLVGFIAPLGDKKLDHLKYGSQLKKIRDGGSITWSKSLKQYVVVGGDGYIARSCNGLAWEYTQNHSLKSLSKVIWNEDLKHYIAIGKAGALAISEDGKVWRVCDASSKQNLNDILWCPQKNHYILIGDEGYVALSKDGINWEIQTISIKKDTTASKSDMLGIAGTDRWNNGAYYIMISKQDKAFQSKDGKEWELASVAAKGMRTVFYNHINGGDWKTLGTRRFFAIVVSQNVGTGLFRYFKYHAKGTKTAPNYNHTSNAWVRDVINTPASTKLSGVKRVLWIDAFKVFLVVAATPAVFYGKGIAPDTAYKNVKIDADFSLHIKEGFSDIACGEIPEFKDDEKVIYYDLNQYS